MNKTEREREIFEGPTIVGMLTEGQKQIQAVLERHEQRFDDIKTHIDNKFEKLTDEFHAYCVKEVESCAVCKDDINKRTTPRWALVGVCVAVVALFSAVGVGLWTNMNVLASQKAEAQQIEHRITILEHIKK